MSWLQDQMRGLDALQKLLDKLPPESPMCRDAWCGEWERCNGEYEAHAAHIDGRDDAQT
ncbi:MAG: hypothetical protein ABR532_01550 [Candidatus Dormibacteria bacterium]